MKKFYKNSNGEIVIDSYIIPSGMMVKAVLLNNYLEVLIPHLNVSFKGVAADFCTEAGVAYSTIADILAATVNTASVTATVTGGATSAKQDTGNASLAAIASKYTPLKITAELTRPADTTAYIAGDCINSSVASPVPLTMAGAANVAGGGGIATLLKIESNMTALASATLRLWFFNDVPAGLVGDNVAYVNSYANSGVRCFYVDVTFDPLLAGSDTVYGQAVVWNQYMTAGTTDLSLAIQTLSAFTPTSGGKIKVSLSVLKLS